MKRTAENTYLVWGSYEHVNSMANRAPKPVGFDEMYRGTLVLFWSIMTRTRQQYSQPIWSTPGCFKRLRPIREIDLPGDKKSATHFTVYICKLQVWSSVWGSRLTVVRGVLWAKYYSTQKFRKKKITANAKKTKWLKHFLISTYSGFFFAGEVKIYEEVPYFVQVGWGSQL